MMATEPVFLETWIRTYLYLIIERFFPENSCEEHLLPVSRLIWENLSAAWIDCKKYWTIDTFVFRQRIPIENCNYFSHHECTMDALKEKRKTIRQCFFSGILFLFNIIIIHSLVWMRILVIWYIHVKNQKIILKIKVVCYFKWTDL